MNSTTHLPSTKPGLSARLSADGLSIVLRADTIRTETLTALAAAWGETGGADDITAALDYLSGAVAGNPTDGELDRLADDVEDAGCMGPAEVAMSLRDAVRLRDQLDAVIARRLPAVVRGAA